jgi:CheY-like chemotaxis protein
MEGVTSTTRFPENLSPEPIGSRPELPPIRCFQVTINAALDELTRRVVVQLEGALRGHKVTYLALD